MTDAVRIYVFEVYIEDSDFFETYKEDFLKRKGEIHGLYENYIDLLML